MKKLLLLSAGALLSLSAMAEITVAEGYKLTQDWTTTENIPAIATARQAAAFNEKIYVNDRSTQTLYSFGYDKTADKVVRTEVISAGNAAGAVGISMDSKGNAILLTGWAGAGAMQSVMLWEAETGKTSTISITLPDDVTAARMDYLGRTAGDIFSAEGGAVYFTANGSADKIAKIWIANGAQDTEKTVSITSPVTTTNNMAIVVPLTNDPTSDNILYRYSTDKNFYQYNGTEWTQFATPEGAKTSASTGGDAILLNNGIVYTIEPAGTNFFDGWQIVERGTEAKVIASFPETLSAANKTSYGPSLILEKVTETKANVYTYQPGGYATKYTLEVPDLATAIESVAVDANAPVEYYNLQGVKVANPENGLFIKKQGNKATKVIL